jgi:hypothetical protein
MGDTTANKNSDGSSEHGGISVLKSGRSPRSHVRKVRAFANSFKASPTPFSSTEFNRKPINIIDALENGFVAIQYHKSRRGVVIPNSDFNELGSILDDAATIAEKYFELLHQQDEENLDELYKIYTKNAQWVESQGSRVLDVDTAELSAAYAPGATER